MIIAVDIGGTKTLVATFEGQQITKQVRFATPKESMDFLNDLLPVIKAQAGRKQIDAISVAAPGIVDHYGGRIVRCGNLPWLDVPIRSTLKKAFNCPVYLENDANLAGLAEARSLVPIPQLSLYITVSTGIGSGIVINGKLVPALSGSEAGHMMLWRSDVDRLDKWQDYASGKAMRKRTRQFASEIDSTRIWREVAERVAEGLLVLIPTLQPHVVIIGGSIGTHFDARWRQALENILNEKMSDYITVPPIVQAQNPEHAVLYGCQYYAEDKLDDL